jgi:DNA mismatch endonuclease (patch repair protein)
MQSSRQRDTAIEQDLRRELAALGISFQSHITPVPGSRSRPDLVFAAARVAVYVNGCFWHGCAEHGTWPKHNAAWWRAKIEANRQRDARADEFLSKAGWIALRFWEHDDPRVAAHRIAQQVSERDIVAGHPANRG